jgi:cell division protein FtsB
VLAVIAGVLAGYVGPVRGYLDGRRELSEQEATLARAERQRDGIAAQLRALDRPAVLEARARELGLVRPGETPFVVRGLEGP